MTRRRALAAASLATVVAAVAVAFAAPSRSQTFFREALLADRGTSKTIKDLLRTGGGFVERGITFADLTGDERDDAVVRVTTGGADGAVAVYVLSTDVRDPDDELHVVFRSQRLRRASTRVRDGVLSYRFARYELGDEPCCPSRIAESELRWDDERKRFVVAERRDVTPPSP